MLSKAKYLMGIGKPKNQHSLENLKYLYGILNKNQIVTENNKDLLIETLRSISEILIWGDQNDSSVFDFFLERQMITFFLHYMKQKYGRYICVQLLQTLNILFENIRNETSLYFLLSNNHINNIILHKFDFSDEEVMAYYISFLKTLSLKLNSHSIHFFFNERMAEFPLYVEAIKFFDHPESMVRIAVRTLTLNVYKVKVPSMQRFIIEKTAAHYFSNLVWLMRNHVLDLDLCVKNTTDHTKRCRLTDLIDEYVDHLSYLQDIYTINNPDLCVCLTEELVRRLLVPICLGSIIKKDFRKASSSSSGIQPYVAVFALSHIFSIITYEPILSELCELIFFTTDAKYLSQLCCKTVRSSHNLADPNSLATYSVDYLAEPKPLIHCLNSLSSNNATAETAAVTTSGHQSKIGLSAASKTRSRSVPHFSHLNHRSSITANMSQSETSETAVDDQIDNLAQRMSDIISPSEEETATTTTTKIGSDNKTDDEKYRQIVSHRASLSNERPQGVIIEAILHNLDTPDYNEMHALITLSFLFTLMKNPGLESKFQDMLLCVKVMSKSSSNSNNDMMVSTTYNEALMSKLIGIVSKSVEPEFKVRLATLELAIKLIKSLVIVNKRSYISDFHLACIEQAREQSSFILRQKFKSEEMFLDMFEHEYQDLNSNMIINFEMLLRDWSILLPPTSTPLSGIEFARRFPCGDTEKLKQAVCTFFLIRSLCLNLTNQTETQLPLTKQEYLVKENDALDLNSSDLIACTVNLKDKKDRRFLVIDPIQFILVEPEVKRIGWGIVKFSDLIQDVEVSPDKEDSRSLNITIKKTNVAHGNKADIVLNSVFTFDDHIRCMAAKQHLVRARDRARRMKLEKIAQLLDINTTAAGYNTKNNPSYAGVSGAAAAIAGASTSASATASSTQTSGSSSADINYNMVAGFNMHMSNNSVYYPGRAAMISSTWSQIAQPDKSSTNSSIMNSPMSALTSSPVIRNSVVGGTPSSINQQLIKSQTAHQFSFGSSQPPSTPLNSDKRFSAAQLDSSKNEESLHDKSSSSSSSSNDTTPTPVSATSKSGVYEI